MMGTERAERLARHRAECRELAIPVARAAIELLERYLADGDPVDLDRARQKAYQAYRVAARPLGGWVMGS